MARISRFNASRRTKKAWQTRRKRGKAERKAVLNARVRVNERYRKGHKMYEMRLNHPIAVGTLRGAATGVGASAGITFLSKGKVVPHPILIPATAAAGLASGYKSAKAGDVRRTHQLRAQQKQLSRARKKGY